MNQSSYIVNTLISLLLDQVEKQSQLNKKKLLSQEAKFIKQERQISQKYSNQLFYHKNGFLINQKPNQNTLEIKTFRKSCIDSQFHKNLQNSLKLSHINQNTFKINSKRSSLQRFSFKRIQQSKKSNFSVNVSPLKHEQTKNCIALTEQVIKSKLKQEVLDQSLQEVKRLFLKRKALQKQVQNSFSVFQQNKFQKNLTKSKYSSKQKGAKQYIYKSGLNFEVVLDHNLINNHSKKNKSSQLAKNDESSNKQNKFHYSNSHCFPQNRLQILKNKKKHIKALVKTSNIQHHIRQISNLQQCQQTLQNQNFQFLPKVFIQLSSNQQSQLPQSRSKRKLRKQETQINNDALNVQAIIHNMKLAKGVCFESQGKVEEGANQSFLLLNKHYQKNRRHTKRLSQRNSTFRSSIKKDQ